MPKKQSNDQDFSYGYALRAAARLSGLAVVVWAGVMLGLAAGVAAEEESPPDVELVELPAGDEVMLRAHYFPAGGPAGEKGDRDEDEQRAARMEAVPIVILHHWKGRASDYDWLAVYLQSKGHAVVVPDLRGHGESRSDRQNVDRFKDRDIMNMINEDMEAVKKFLLAKNDEKQLNVEKLCVIGVEFGALIAINWAVKDWSWPDLLTGKQGKDVKALVLVSPLSTWRGIKLDTGLRHPDVRERLSMLLIVGAEDSRSLRPTKQLHGKLKRYHPEPLDDEEKGHKTLYYFPQETSLQGLKLLEQDDLHNELIIQKFIEARLVAKRHPWRSRLTGP